MPARLLNVVLRRPSGMHDSSSSLLLKVCTVNTYWLEDSQWLVGCGGCGLVSGACRLFIHKPGGNCKWKHRHLPADTFNDHIVLFLDVVDVWVRRLRCTLCFPGRANRISTQTWSTRKFMQSKLKKMIKFDMKLEVAKTDFILAQSIHLHDSHLGKDRDRHKIWAFMSFYTR